MKFVFMAACILGLSFSLQAQNTAHLSQSHLHYNPKNFYIAEVVDDRDDKTSVGAMQGSPIGLPAPAAGALKGFIASNVLQNKNAQPISLHITQLHFDIKKADDLWQEEGNIVLTFYAGNKNLVEYSGRATKKTDDDPLPFIDEFTRRALENDFEKFDQWWEQNRNNIALSPVMKVNVTLGRTTQKPDCIVYSLQRPLSINDFKGPPEGTGPEMAATMSGTGLATSGEVENGQMVMNIVITPYFNEALSWFKEEGKNPRVLAHEQAHFDITAIKACELIQKIKSTTFTEDNYQQQLQELMQQNTEATNEEQTTYDAETNHGTIKDKQLEWQQKLSEQVRSLGCY